MTYLDHSEQLAVRRTNRLIASFAKARLHPQTTAEIGANLIATAIVMLAASPEHAKHLMRETGEWVEDRVKLRWPS